MIISPTTLILLAAWGDQDACDVINQGYIEAVICCPKHCKLIGVAQNEDVPLSRVWSSQNSEVLRRAFTK